MGKENFAHTREEKLSVIIFITSRGQIFSFFFFLLKWKRLDLQKRKMGVTDHQRDCNAGKVRRLCVQVAKPYTFEPGISIAEWICSYNGRERP